MKTPLLAKTAAVIVGSTILTTLAVNAVDMRGHVVTSFLASLFDAVMPAEVSICPDNMVLVEDALVPFCIDAYEASPGENCVFEDVTGTDQTVLNLGVDECVPVSVSHTVPWRYIDRDQAARACERVGKRLPSMQEWHSAALGTPDVNEGLGLDHCNIAHNRADGVSETGAGMRCVSDVGAYDMIGNVWEWVAGEVIDGMYDEQVVPDSGYVQSASHDGMAVTTAAGADALHSSDRFWSDVGMHAGIMRGGYYDSKSNAGLYAVYAASPPTFTGAATGFRCVTDVQE